LVAAQWRPVLLSANPARAATTASSVGTRTCARARAAHPSSEVDHCSTSASQPARPLQHGVDAVHAPPRTTHARRDERTAAGPRTPRALPAHLGAYARSAAGKLGSRFRSRFARWGVSD
jgi:hypothetical protein